MDKVYNHKVIEGKWQKKWLGSKIYSPDLNKAQKPFYNLMMFPYPSAEGLHVGNMYAFTGTDVYGRFKRMKGFDVFEPIGLDGFGIHSENYAIKVGRHPQEHAKISEKNFYAQLASIGNGFAWDHRLETYDPNYYKWTQWLFIQMFKASLAYKDKAVVNWCPKDKTVLADEQVINGACERCGSHVERREMSSWFFKITDYADRLLTNLKKINWPEKIKLAQSQWIGKSEGVRIEFKIKSFNEKLEVFTTKPETIKGVTFIAISPEKAKTLLNLIDKSVKKEVEEYIKRSLNKTEQARKEEEKLKTGVKTSLVVINPVTDEEIPVWVADYVLSDVGTGVVMGVPEGDERDREFALKHNLKIVKYSAYKSKLGKKEIHYHLRDWGISRQRYWGPPIPMVNCKDCGWQPVPEAELPVILPDIADFEPKGDGTSPLSNAPEKWKKTKCPKCSGPAERELDVSDTFLDSSWYFLAYPNLATREWQGTKNPLNKKITDKWLPVDTYIGGAEHAVLHLLYSRFVWMVLKDQGFLKGVDSDEPFPFLFSHGLIIKDGAKMSKSKGNVVNPDEYIEKFGADTLRLYLMFLGPYNAGGDFRDTGMEGMERFLKRVWNLLTSSKPSKNEKEVTIKMHQTIKKVTNDIENFHYNTAISAIMEFVNLLREKGATKENLKVLCQLLSPFAPHLAEEAWCDILNHKYSVHNSDWPRFDIELVKERQFVVIFQINGKTRSQVIVEKETAVNKGKIEELARKDLKIAKWLKNKKIKKTIFVSGKLMNFVI